MRGGGAPVVVLRAAGAPAPPWRAQLHGVDAELSDGELPPDARQLLGAAECALVDAASVDALVTARLVHRADEELQVVIVVPTEESRRAITRAMVFTPGLGEVWLASPAEVAAAIAQRAAGVTRQRRSYRRTRERISAEAVLRSPQQEERALISDAYLADLLQVTPDPVLSVDATGRILSGNPASERLLARERAMPGTGQLASFLTLPEGESVPALLRRAEQGFTRVEVQFHRRDGETGHGDLLITRVSRAEPPLFAVVLHDLTARTVAQRQLELQAAELEHQAATLREQAEELELVNGELLDQRAALELALDSRSRFYASMSHELRTPINAVVGYNSLVLEGVYGELNPQQRDAITRSQRAAAHLLELVNDVLDLAKIEAGRLEIAPEPVNPRSLVEDLLLSIRPQADANGTELRLQCSVPSEDRVVTDPRRVRQILLNLVSNAVKFGHGKPVVVTCGTPRADVVAFEVCDHGPGIAPEDQQRVFEEFVQLAQPSQKGTGLGLSISRRLARLLGGDLLLRSMPGEGSTFTLELPRSGPPRH